MGKTASQDGLVFATAPASLDHLGGAVDGHLDSKSKQEISEPLAEVDSSNLRGKGI